MAPREILNQRQLARAVGVSQSAVSRYVKRHDWPVKTKGPWTPKEIKTINRWRKDLREPNTADATGPTGPATEGDDDPDYSNLSVAYKKTQIQLNHERMLHERLKRQINGGLYVPRDLLDTALGGLAALFVQVCDELEMSLPSRFAHKRADQIDRELTKMLDSARRRICDKAHYELAHLTKIKKPRKKRRGRPAVGS